MTEKKIRVSRKGHEKPKVEEVEKEKIDCSECEGTGILDCVDCDDGSHDCDECDGDGSVECGCDGCDGSISCDECGGDGWVGCDYCNGSGNFDCTECDGSGKIEPES